MSEIALEYRGVNLTVEYQLSEEDKSTGHRAEIDITGIKTRCGDEVGPIIIHDTIDRVRFEMLVWQEIKKQEYYGDAELEEIEP